jgi:hypothetical protein
MVRDVRTREVAMRVERDVTRQRRQTQPHGSWQDKFIEELRTHGMVLRGDG